MVYKKQKTYRPKKRSKDKKQDRAIRRLQNLVKPEWKVNVARFQGAANNIPAQNTNAAIFDNITQITQGASGVQRIGNSIQVHRIVINGVCLNPGELTNQLQFARFVMYQDLKFTGTAATPSQLLLSYSLTDVDMQNLLTDFNYNYCKHKEYNRGGQLRILMDKKIQLNSNSGVVHPGTGDTAYAYIAKHDQRRFHYSKTFKRPLLVNFEGDVSTTGKGGAIFICTLPGSDTTGTDNPYITWQATIYFTDS